MKYSTLPEGFPDRFREAVLRSGLTPVEIARRSGCARSKIYEYMCGQSCPGLLAAAKLARVLGVSLDYLAFGGGYK